MSDVSGGPGWWRASDGRWYPPEQHPEAAYREGFAAGAQAGSRAEPSPRPLTPPPPLGAADSPASSGRQRWVLVVGLVVLVAVVVAGVVMVVARDDSTGVASASVTLEPSTEAGADPFTSSVAISEVSVFPASVSAVSADVRGQLETDAATGTLVAVGSTTPGLYGGSQEEVCKPEELVAFLEGDQAKASAWAGVFGIDPSTIGEFVGGLTPLVLTSDTWVTNHGFAGGEATPRQSVLQAGTAVLVDSTGVPRVKCSCGNPLLEPTREQLSSVEVVGDPWDGYDPATVTVVDAGTPTETFTVVDIETGDTFQQDTGSSVGGTDIRSIDVNNATYPAGVCNSPGPVNVADGRFGPDGAYVPGMSRGQLGVSTYGDVDGDGDEELVVEVFCDVGAASSMLSTLVVLRAGDDGFEWFRPILYGPPGSSTAPGRTGVDAVSVQDGEVVVVFATLLPGDALCCPSGSETARFKFNGQTFERVA